MPQALIHPRALWLSVIITLLFGLASFRVTVWSTSGNLVWSDGVAYFLFARSLVLDHDSDITNEFEDLDKLQSGVSSTGTSLMDSIRMNTQKNPATGRIFSPWPVGAGVVMAPFYALGYAMESVAASIHGRPINSYGLIPQYFFCLGSLAFGLIGFWATYLCCRRVADTGSAYIATLAAILGGPAVFYMFVNPSMAHAMSFGLVATYVLLWWRQWDEGSTLKGVVCLGLIIGMLASIRIQNAIFGVFLAALLLRELRRIRFPTAVLYGACGAFTAALAWAPQILHAHAYGPPNAAISLAPGGILMIGSYPINLTSPFFFDVLFACRHGAFHWAPILLIAAIGLLFTLHRQVWAWVFLATIALHVYLIGGLAIVNLTDHTATFDTANWNDHWKGGTSFGMRYLTECSALFAVGLAVLLQTISKHVRIIWPAIVLGLLTAWNGLLILAYGLGTVSRSYCVTYEDMLNGVGLALMKLLGPILRLFS